MLGSDLMKNSFRILLTPQQLNVVELILNTGLKPLKGFMNQNEYNEVLENKTLNGSPWTIPYTYKFKGKDNYLNLSNKENIVFEDVYGKPVAHFKVDSIFKIDTLKECQSVYGTTDDNHPAVRKLLHDDNTFGAGGTLTKIKDIEYHDFVQFRKTPDDIKKLKEERNLDALIGFQTRNPVHNSHAFLMTNAMQTLLDSGEYKNPGVLLHPVSDVNQKNDINLNTRMLCYQSILPHLSSNGNALLSILPYDMHMGGPAEAVMHAIIRKNFGCTHFITGRDHAGPSTDDKNGNKFYGNYEAQDYLLKVSDQIGIKILTSPNVVYSEKKKTYITADKLEEGEEVSNISGTLLRQKIREDLPVPEWFSRPDVVRILKNKNSKGLCLYFTGLSGSGKTTIASKVKHLLEANPDEKRMVSLLDGDEIRRNLSKGLGFSKEDRSTNVRRIGYVASKLVDANSIVLCSNIAPYAEDREYNRKHINNYVEIFCDSSVEECERRDPKLNYTVLSDVKKSASDYEVPEDSEIVLDTTVDTQETNVNKVIDYLRDKGLI